MYNIMHNMPLIMPTIMRMILVETNRNFFLKKSCFCFGCSEQKTANGKNTQTAKREKTYQKTCGKRTKKRLPK